MALNREQKRQLKKRGDVGDAGDDTGDGGGGTGGGDGGSASAGDSEPRRRSNRPGTAAVATKEPRTSPRQFVKEVRSELRKVAWPSRKETLQYSGVVALTLVFLTTLIFLLDSAFQEVVLRLFNVK
jgi:preprotein translocase subunit SecE